MSLSLLNAAADLRRLSHQQLVEGLSFGALISANASANYDPPAWRSLSNLIGEGWPERGLSARHAWWGPRQSDAKALAGNRSLSAGSTANGGNTVIASAVASIASALRPRLTLEIAGAQRVEVAGVADYVAPQWNETGLVGTWIAENSDAGSAALSVQTVAVTPKTTGVTLEVSRRFVQNAIASEAVLTAEIRRQVGGIVESAFFTGSGTEQQPLGLLLTPGAVAVPFAGAVPTYAEVCDCLDGYYASSADPTAATAFLHPSTFVALMEVQQGSGTGTYAASVAAGNRYLLGGVPAQITSHMPAGRLLICDPRKIQTVYWMAPQIVVNRYALDTSGGVRFTILSEVNVAVQHVSQLVVGG